MTGPYEGFVIPSTPGDQLRLSQMMKEIVNSMVRSKAEREHKTEIIRTISEEFEIPKKFISAAAKIMYNQNMEEVNAMNEDLSNLVDTINQAISRNQKMLVQMANAQTTSSDHEDGDDEDDNADYHEELNNCTQGSTSQEDEVDDILDQLYQSN